MKKIVVAAALAACSVSAARAQVPRVFPVPTAGELIRVTPDSGAPYTGRLTGLGGDTIYLRPEIGDSALFRVAIASRERVEVHRSHREGWSGLGALSGVAAGVLASQFQSPSGNENVKRMQTAVVGGAAGAVAGGLIGFFAAPGRWQPLRTRLPRRTAALPPSPGEPPAPPPATADSSATPVPAPQPVTTTPTQPAPTPPTAPPASPAPPSTRI